MAFHLEKGREQTLEKQVYLTVLQWESITENGAKGKDDVMRKQEGKDTFVPSLGMSITHLERLVFCSVASVIVWVQILLLSLSYNCMISFGSHPMGCTWQESLVNEHAQEHPEVFSK